MKRRVLFCCLFLWGTYSGARAQPAPEPRAAQIAERLTRLQAAVKELNAKDPDRYLLADVAVFAKAAEWATRHQEFYTPQYAEQAIKGLDLGLERAAHLARLVRRQTNRPRARNHSGSWRSSRRQKSRGP